MPPQVAAVLTTAGYDVVNAALAIRPMHVQNILRAPGAAGPPQTPGPLRSYTSPDEIRGAVDYVPLADQWVF